MSNESSAPVPPPESPRRGMHLVVQRADEHWSMWPEWRVDRVNSRSFYVRSGPVRERHLLVEWLAWLRSLSRRGTLVVDGEPVRLRPVDAQAPNDDSHGSGTDGDVSGLLRRARSLARRSPLRRTDSERLRQAEIRPDGPRPGWRVLLSTDWSAGPLCSCAGDVEPPTGRPCEHAVAACLLYEDLRCQLLDLLLAN